ncbi:MAG: NAD+ synthase [Coleofasciculaceae cyanobacterium RL_1_1]|nr:NAD+ synthase [Coleofasciculaceae cyanobacterium RL_1_1]
MNIAIAQLNPTVGDLSGNADRILAAAQRATQAATDCALLLTPELSICGYPPRDLLLDPSFIDAMDAAVRELARRLPADLAVLVGMAVRNPHADREGGKALFNSIALLQHGTIAKIFHKRLLPTYDVFDENRYFEPDPNLDVTRNIFTLKAAGQTQTIGVTICEDLWNDEAFWGKRNYRVNPIADLAAAGVDAIVNLSASPYTQRKQTLREAMLSDAAQRYGLPIFYANQVGGNDDLIFDGNSVVVDASGAIVARAAHCQTDAIQIAIDAPSQNFTLRPATIAPYPEDDNAEIWAALVLGVQDYARKCGFSRAVLGLSGGIDSTLVAAIAAEALGAKNVLGVLMSSPYTSQASVDDAIALAANLGIQTQTLPILPMMNGFDQSLDILFAGTEPGIAEENLQSRIRGTLLMAIANKFGYLLLSTGNKSEVAVGYCTLYGDMNGGLAVIADVPKTRVYALCGWINRDRGGEIVPRNVIEKPPSAELRPDQRDSDSLPDYDTLDDILDRLVHSHQSADQIIAAGHDRATVERIIALVTRAEFKRRQAAPGLKITDRAFGTGWRMPIAARRTISL